MTARRQARACLPAGLLPRRLATVCLRTPACAVPRPFVVHPPRLTSGYPWGSTARLPGHLEILNEKSVRRKLLEVNPHFAQARRPSTISARAAARLPASPLCPVQLGGRVCWGAAVDSRAGLALAVHAGTHARYPPPPPLHAQPNSTEFDMALEWRARHVAAAMAKEDLCVALANELAQLLRRWTGVSASAALATSRGWGGRDAAAARGAGRALLKDPGLRAAVGRVVTIAWPRHAS